ncbi:BON domain-containing protein [Deinococcus sp. KNUC1210]|uniref:BON domain-containing protein n=1 Tax=Deinococcus sp. KNUC1210 TaxID=2917691 RepID=UPI001EF09735|nr:BON domain-containing protein [Deinococcus sp. KNUC1210]ULH16575.1 BON domain-containing protein [Deinococcus sp. KNUC1210]
MWPFGKSTVDRVKDAFKAQALLAPLNLDVRIDNGTAFVTGQVPTQNYLGLIKVVATGISGVKAVDTSGLVFDTPAAQAAPAAPEVSVDTGGTIDASTDAQATQGQYDQAAGDDIVAKALAEHNRIAKGVFNALQSNGELKDDPIDVLQSGTSIILRGAVDSEHELHLAAQLARSIEGVEAVDASGLKVVGGAKELTKEKDAGGETVYTVQSGDNLSSIALKYFGDAGKYRDIAHYNNISNPDLIQVGQKIRIPG